MIKSSTLTFVYHQIYMLDSIVSAYSDHDFAQIKKMLNNPFIKHMDVEFAILAKSLAEKWIVEPVCYDYYCYIMFYNYYTFLQILII